jgi:hypothetical protein
MVWYVAECPRSLRTSASRCQYSLATVSFGRQTLRVWFCNNDASLFLCTLAFVTCLSFHCFVPMLVYGPVQFGSCTLSLSSRRNKKAKKKKEELSSYKRQSSNLFSGGSCRPLRMLNAATETKTHGHVFGACVVQFTRG